MFTFREPQSTGFCHLCSIALGQLRLSEYGKAPPSIFFLPDTTGDRTKRPTQQAFTGREMYSTQAFSQKTQANARMHFSGNVCAHANAGVLFRICGVKSNKLSLWAQSATI